LTAWLRRDEAHGSAFLLDPEDSRAGEKLIVFVACCEGVVVLLALLAGVWMYLKS
jgi:hypothetical protein